MFLSRTWVIHDVPGHNLVSYITNDSFKFVFRLIRIKIREIGRTQSLALACFYVSISSFLLFFFSSALFFRCRSWFFFVFRWNDWTKANNYVKRNEKGKERNIVVVVVINESKELCFVKLFLERKQNEK